MTDILKPENSSVVTENSKELTFKVKEDVFEYLNLGSNIYGIYIPYKVFGVKAEENTDGL